MNSNYLPTLTGRITKLEKELRHVHNNTLFMNDDIIRSRNIQAQTAQIIKQQKQNNGVKNIKVPPPKLPTQMNVSKIVCLNKNNQISPTNLSEWISFSDANMKVKDRGDGGVIIDAFTLRDLEIKKQQTVESIQPIQIHSTDNSIMIGKKNLVKLSIDDNGTMNITNQTQKGDLNEVDIYSEKINFLSNVESTNPNTGSIVTYGGMGIMKNLSIGGGIVLPTKAGIPTKLDYFEEGTLSIVWTGIWNGSIDATYIYQRMGHLVTLCIPYTTNRSTVAGVITNTQETYLPKRLRPNYDIKYTVEGQDDGISMAIVVSIFGDDGKIKIYPKNGKVFSGSGISGFDTFCVSYMTRIVNDN